jgi:glycosyltransferase involved in cell wall biosynthesis
VSVIVPARNEARHIERCVRSILATDWPHLELVVVDDHSSDGTGDLARTAGHGDPRLRVVAPPPLPSDWFGKQWACWHGAQEARGTLLLFTDADTWHAPDLVPRLVRALEASGVALMSVAGTQEMETFWERLVLPIPFFFLLLRFGGADRVERARTPRDAIANGQCFLVRRDAYDAIGGHAAVRDTVAEDLMIGQRMAASGRRVGVRLGLAQLRTRMYTSLGTLVAGWAKNVYAGGRHFIPDQPVAQALYRAALVAGPWWFVLPFVLAGLGLAGVVPPWLRDAGLVAAFAQTAWACLGYALLRLPPWLGLLHPLGMAVMSWIGLVSVWRGDRVRWKGRTYRAA